MLRLGLERGKTAKEALEIITKLLEVHGQGGSCSETIADLHYHGSFLIVDRIEAWVLETASNIWAAERITSGYRNISNCLSIRTKIYLHSSNLHEYAISNGLWDESQGDLDFAKVYGGYTHGKGRYYCGKELLRKLSASGKFKGKDMFSILRDKDSGICMIKDNMCSMGSQVSVLTPKDSSKTACHWFTGTPDPTHSVYKPFIFCPNVRISHRVISPTFPDDEDPAKILPRFQSKVDRRHDLYKHHEMVYNMMEKINEESQNLGAAMKKLESTCMRVVDNFLDSFEDYYTEEVEYLFEYAVETEIKLYKKALK